MLVISRSIVSYLRVKKKLKISEIHVYFHGDLRSRIIRWNFFLSIFVISANFYAVWKKRSWNFVEKRRFYALLKCMRTIGFLIFKKCDGMISDLHIRYETLSVKFNEPPKTFGRCLKRILCRMTQKIIVFNSEEWYEKYIFSLVSCHFLWKRQHFLLPKN